MIKPGLRPGSGDLVFCERRDVAHADTVSNCLTFLLDRLKRIGANEGDVLDRFTSRRGVPQRLFHAVGDAKDRVQCLLFLIDRGGAKRSCCGQFFIGKGDLKPPGVVLPHLGAGVGHGGPVAEAGNIHSPDVKARVTMHHPVGQGESHTAALTEAGHHTTGAPEIAKPPDRSDQRIAIRRECERPVDNLFNARMFKRGEMSKSHFQGWCNPIEVFLQQFVSKVPWGFFWAPGNAGFFISAHEHAFAFLAKIELAIRIHDMKDFFASGLIDLFDLWHVLGNEIHVFHRKHGKLEANHASDLPRPESAGINNVLRFDRALFSND